MSTPKKRIVTIGGGTGQPELLRGLREYDVDLTAIVTTVDNGGSTGQLREEYHVVPPGDIRRCIAALSPQEDQMHAWWNYRFEGGSLNGHTLGNIVLTGLELQQGTIQNAIDIVGKLFQCTGQVLPVTLDDTQLMARLEDGTVITGETNIDVPKHDARLHIEEIFLSQPVTISADVAAAIAQADLIVLSPGDLYTSVLVNLLIGGMKEAIANSNAKIAYVCNRSTKQGETHDFTTQDFYQEINKYLAPGTLDYMIIDSEEISIPSHAQAVEYVPFGSEVAVEVIRIDLADEQNPAHVSGTKAAASVYALCASL